MSRIALVLLLLFCGASQAVLAGSFVGEEYVKIVHTPNVPASTFSIETPNGYVELPPLILKDTIDTINWFDTSTPEGSMLLQEIGQPNIPTKLILDDHYTPMSFDFSDYKLDAVGVEFYGYTQWWTPTKVFVRYEFRGEPISTAEPSALLLFVLCSTPLVFMRRSQAVWHQGRLDRA